jgi:hypothetical protein
LANPLQCTNDLHPNSVQRGGCFQGDLRIRHAELVFEFAQAFLADQVFDHAGALVGERQFVDVDLIAAVLALAQFGAHLVQQDLAQVGEETARAVGLEFLQPVERAQQGGLDQVVGIGDVARAHGRAGGRAPSAAAVASPLRMRRNNC